MTSPDSVENPRRLPEIQREISSVIIISADDKMLMGRRDSNSGGVYPDAWHIPGGGVEEGETLKQAAVREVEQEVGMVLPETMLSLVGKPRYGATEKRLKDGSEVFCRMTFNMFEARLLSVAARTPTKPGDDLVTLDWFDRDVLSGLQLIPGGEDFFREHGYID